MKLSFTFLEMPESFSKPVLTPAITFADEPLGYIAPQIAVAGDAGGARFTKEIVLAVPKLLYLLDYPGGESAFTDLAVDVKSPFFAAHPDWEYELALQLDGKPLDKRLFYTWYGRNQFFIPIPTFRNQLHQLTLSARPTRAGTASADTPLFEVQLHLTAKAHLWRELERRAIWVFSTARSGSTWLAMDVLCAGLRARPMDEPGIGRMFAPLQWDAERFFDPASRARRIESGLNFETGETRRGGGELPVFERFFSDMSKENQLLRTHNFEFYHRALRDVALNHVLNEWGMLDFPRIVFKLPNDSHGADFIMRAFPQSHMIFLIRDGRDVMRSRFSPFASSILANSKDPELRRYAIAYYSHLWNFQVDITRQAFDAHEEPRRIFLRYEDMRADPVKVIADVYSRLGIPATSEEVVRVAQESQLENRPESERGSDKPRQEGRVGGYKQSFSDAEISLMNAIMGPNLRQYGYSL